MFITSISGFFDVNRGKNLVRFILGVSSLGIIFAGSFVWQEILRWINFGNPNYTLILPTCAYGLIFYVLIFVLAVRQVKRTY